MNIIDHGLKMLNNISVIEFLTYDLTIIYILSVSEKLPVSKCPYFGKYIIHLYGFFYVHVSGQRQAVWKDKTMPRALELGARDACFFLSFRSF